MILQYILSQIKLKSLVCDHDLLIYSTEARQENGTTDPERRAALDAAIKRRKEKLALNKQKSGMNGKNGKKDVKVSKKGKRNIQSSVNTVDECLAKALESIDTFNFDQAKKFCKKAIELDPRNLKALELYGDILAEEGEIEKAMEISFSN